MSYFINAITQHYVDFQGRARRKEYWMYVLFTVVFTFVAAILDNVLGTTFTMDVLGESVDTGYGWIYLILALGTFLPALAVSVRRLHDVGKSGWFLLVALIPLAGIIWLLVLQCTDSQSGANQYGPNPKGVSGTTGNTAAPMGFCSKCGASRTAGAAFCAACGNPA